MQSSQPRLHYIAVPLNYFIHRPVYLPDIASGLLYWIAVTVSGVN